MLFYVTYVGTQGTTGEVLQILTYILMALTAVSVTVLDRANAYSDGRFCFLSLYPREP